MKILLSSHSFPPSIGGIEEVGSILAREFTRRGHEVIVVTQTPGQTPWQTPGQARGVEPFPFAVKRAPRMAELPGLTRWSDIVFHNNVSLRTAWPLALVRRPWVVAHHTWIARPNGRRAAVDHVKLRAIRGAINIAVSSAIASKLGVEPLIIPNPYRDDLFRITGEPARDRDVIFLGRLVSDKGAGVLIDALMMLEDRSVRTTIVGEGPERDVLEARARQLGVDVTFAGAKRGNELVAMLNQHRLLVVPSRWEEPFGLVVLEAMACGCVPLVARSGGLPEAAGDAGVTFEKENARALAERLGQLLNDESLLADLRLRAPAHLERHRAAVIAGQYLEVFEEALR